MGVKRKIASTLGVSGACADTHQRYEPNAVEEALVLTRLAPDRPWSGVSIGRSPAPTGNLKNYRSRRGWSQAELARRLGTRQVYVANLETSRKTPSLRMLERLARALRVAPWRLLR